MSVDIKRVDRSIVIVVLFLGIVTYTLGEPAEPKYCQTEDCQTTAKEFDKLIDWNADTCADFYQFACGSGPPEELAGYRTQEQYLNEQLANITSNDDKILTLDPSPSDPPLLHLIKRYYRLCTDQGALNNAGLLPIIRVLGKAAASHTTWWKLENWAVSVGLNSSLFAVEIESHMYREDKKGAIILVPPHTPIYKRDHFEVSIKAIETLTTEGMDLSLATKLRNGLLKEFDFYDIVQDPRLSERHNYGERNPVPFSEWHGLWNTQRKYPTSPLAMNWENYVNNYWKYSVTSKVIVPLINNGMYKTWIAYPKFIQTLGSKVEEFSPGDLIDMILWRITNQLIQYAGQDMRDILNLEPVNPTSCQTPAMQDVALKDRWWKIYPKTIRTPIRKMYANIDLQVKLFNYKKMPKVLPDKEALTPRERRQHDELYRMSGILTKKVQSILLELNTAEAELKKIKAEKYPWWCTDTEGSSDCTDLIRKYHQSKKRIPELTEQVTTLNSYYSAKQAEMLRCLSRIKKFEDKHAGHPYVTRMGYASDHVALRSYVRDQQYPGKFPYQNTFTQPALIVERPSHTDTYVELALGVRRWERGMLLRETESFALLHGVEDFIVNTISQGTFARFRNDRTSSLNYGALGSVIGAELWKKLNVFERDAYAKVEECVARGFRRGSGPQLIYDTIWDVFSVSNLRYALQVAFNGFKRTIAIAGEHDVRLVQDTNVKDEKISELSDEKLFFLAFANQYCSKEPDNSSHYFIDTIMGITPQFKEIFECSKVSGSFPADPCVPERKPEDRDDD